MITSIRRFLLVNLLLCVTLITSLAVISNLFLEHIRFQKQVDAQLNFAAYTIDAFLTPTSSKEDIAVIQKKINHIPHAIAKFHYDKSESPQIITDLLRSIQYQVWDKKQHLLLSSPDAPNVGPVLKNKYSEYSNTWDKSNPWRIFSLYRPESGIHIVTMQANTFRIETEKKITQDAIAVMLVIYPFLGLLIWMIVGQGLSAIKKTVRELKYRSSPNRLKPLKTDDAPVEIQPLINEINFMFSKLNEAFSREKRFASDAAHELRTPLAGINMQAQVAVNASDDASRKTALNHLMTAVNHSLHVVQQLLTLSRMMPSANINKPTHIDINALIDKALANLKPTIEKKQAIIKRKGLTKPVYLLGNETSLLILLRNLIDNAIRYSPAPATITIDHSTQGAKKLLRSVITAQAYPKNSITVCLNDFTVAAMYNISKAQA